PAILLLLVRRAFSLLRPFVPSSTLTSSCSLHPHSHPIPALSFPTRRSSDLAQLGSLRDLDFGIYPYTTSSNTIAAYAPIGCGYPDRKSTRLNSSHVSISYADFCFTKKSTADRTMLPYPVSKHVHSTSPVSIR